MFMSDADVADMTGYQKPSLQIKWLEANRFGYVVSSDGKPKVLREVVLSRLGTGAVKQKKEPQLRL